MIAGSLAQTTTGTAAPAPNSNAGTWRDTSLSALQRVQAAYTTLQTGTSAAESTAAACFMLQVRPVLPLVQTAPNLADAIIADPTLGGKLAGTKALPSAYAWKAATSSLDAAIALLSGTGIAERMTPVEYALVQFTCASFAMNKAAQAFASRDYATLLTLEPYAGWGHSGLIKLLAQAKIATQAADAMAWAKLAYFTQDFAQTQAGIDCVTGAFRAQDNIAAAKAFIDYQESGTGANPLASVPLPNVTFVQLTPDVEALNKAVAGDMQGALDVATAAYATTPAGPNYQSAVAFRAKWLRNFDGNLVRANAFVTSQK